MQAATTLMTASVGSSGLGSGRSSRRMSNGAWIVATRIAPPYDVVHDTARPLCSISYLRYLRPVTEDYLARIGKLIRDARVHRGWTQQELAAVLNTSQSAVNRMERGHQNITLEMVARIGEALDSEIVSFGGGPTHLRVTGPTTLSGSIDVKTSKNAGVALLCATLLNRGRTTLRKVARIEEVNRLLEVLQSLGVQTRWLNADNDLEIIPPASLDLSSIDEAAARRTRSVIMF